MDSVVFQVLSLRGVVLLRRLNATQRQGKEEGMFEKISEQLERHGTQAARETATLFTCTQYGDCDQTWFLSSLGSHKFFSKE